MSYISHDHEITCNTELITNDIQQGRILDPLLFQLDLCISDVSGAFNGNTLSFADDTTINISDVNIYKYIIYCKVNSEVKPLTD